MDSFFRWFWKRYKSFVLVFTVIIILVLIVIYYIFAFTSPIPAGKNLSRSDWLNFVGSVLVLLGSIVVSIVSISQAAYFNEKEKKNHLQDRIEDIKPYIVIQV